MDSYTERNEILTSLGFKNYRAYLRSETWKNIRLRVLLLDQLCFSCRSVANQVHHGEYTEQNLTGASLSDMYSICGKCHRWIETTKAGYKRNPQQATRELFRIRKLMSVRRSSQLTTPLFNH